MSKVEDIELLGGMIKYLDIHNGKLRVVFDLKMLFTMLIYFLSFAQRIL